MNSLISSFRSAVRVQPARAYTPTFTAYRAYSAAPSPADSTSPSSSAPSSASSSSSSASPPPSDGQAALDAVIGKVQAAKFPTRPSGNPIRDYAARKGPAHRAAYGLLEADLPSSAVSSYASHFPGQDRLSASPDEKWRVQSQQGVGYSEPVTTTSARSVAVAQGDVARAYKRLNRILQENNVRRELKRQERFESPSNKRVRLNSERHRRRFKVAVGKAVALAMRMKDL